MINRRPAFRATALLAGGAFALHELSYALDPATEAAGADHGYLAIAGPLIALALALAAGQFLGHLARARGTGESRRLRAGSPTRIWLAATAALLAVYGVQEATERLLAGGHSGEPGILLGPGAVYALPLALAIGALIAVALRGAEVAIALVARRRPRRRRAASGVARALPGRIHLARRGPIALKLAGRAPPVASV